MSTETEYAGQIAQALEADTLYIDPEVEWQSDVEGLQAVQQEAAELDFDVFVIVVPEERAGADLLTLVDALRPGNGEEDGVYFLTTPERMGYSRVELPYEQSSVVYDQLRIAREEGSGSLAPETALLKTVKLFKDPQAAPVRAEEHQAFPDEGPAQPREPLSGDGLLLLVLSIALAAALLTAGFFSLRTLRRRRRADYRLPASLVRKASALQQQALREELSGSSLTVADELAVFDTSHLDAACQRRVEHGLDAYRHAARIIDDESSSAVDLAGALVLLRTAGHELAVVRRNTAERARPAGRWKPRRRGKAESEERLCTIDPTHGEAALRTLVVASRHGTASLPVCRTCHSALKAGKEPDWLYDGDKPYPQGSSVWAETLFGTVGPDLVTQLARQPGGPRRRRR